MTVPSETIYQDLRGSCCQLLPFLEISPFPNFISPQPPAFPDSPPQLSPGLASKFFCGWLVRAVRAVRAAVSGTAANDCSQGSSVPALRRSQGPGFADLHQGGRGAWRSWPPDMSHLQTPIGTCTAAVESRPQARIWLFRQR